MLARILDKFSKREQKCSLLALGDSIISDCYPGPGLGVASLLYRNADAVYPEWRGRDLFSLYPDSVRCGETRTGHRLMELSRISMPRQVAEVGLLSVGGNDMLQADQVDEAWFASFQQRYRDYLQAIRPLARRWLICNVYDPTDGTGLLPGRMERQLPPLPGMVENLQRLNRVIATEAGPCLVDIHEYCRGHGWPSGGDVWFQMDIEPSRTGASRLRELLWKHL